MDDPSTAAPTGDWRSIRVAFSSGESEEAAPSIRRELDAAIIEFRQLFPTFVAEELRREPTDIQVLEDIVRIEGGFQFRDLLRAPSFRMTDERQQDALTSGLNVAAVDYLEGVRTSTERAKRAFRDLFTRCDVVLSASRPDIAPLLDQVRAPRDATKMSNLLAATGNLAGVPGVSFPCGFSVEGMPVGLQLVGPPGSDGLLLAMVGVFQRTTEHHLQHPTDTDV